MSNLRDAPSATHRKCRTEAGCEFDVQDAGVPAAYPVILNRRIQPTLTGAFAMSDRKPVWSWVDSVKASKMPQGAKHLCLTLSTRMKSAKVGCFPSQDLLQLEMSCSSRAIYSYTKVAERFGYLIVDRRRRADGKYQGHTYRPAVPRTENSASPVRGPSEETSGGMYSPSENTVTSHRKYLPNNYPNQNHQNTTSTIKSGPPPRVQLLAENGAMASDQSVKTGGSEQLNRAVAAMGDNVRKRQNAVVLNTDAC